MKFRKYRSLGKGATASACLLLATLLPVVGSQTVASASPTDTTSTSAPMPGVISVEYTTQNPFSPTSTSAAPAVVNPASCKLYASVVHERTVPLSVGNKPYTICNYAVTSIQQSVQMWKNGALGPDAVDSPFNGGNTGQASYTQKTVEVFCTNKLPTYWFATVDGTIVEGGTTYYAYVQTPTTDALDCGT